MKRFLAYRYECDYCGKRSCSGGGMSTHEKHCTMNPERECRMCAAAERSFGEGGQIPTAALIEAIGVADEAGIAAVRELTSCPACILAAIRQTGGTLRDRGETWMDGDGQTISVLEAVPFDYAEECKRFWSDFNAAEREQDCASYVGCW